MQSNTTNPTNTVLTTICPPYDSRSLKDPETIQEFVTFINALPKPLSISCLISALNGPLNIYAVDNPISAQPSYGRNNPRIFIMKRNLILGVVPSGIAKDFIELSEVTADHRSVKAELQFPITESLNLNSPFTRILNSSNTGTQCNACHGSESLNTVYSAQFGYESNLILPNNLQRVFKDELFLLKTNCTSSITDFRCTMIRALSTHGDPVDAEIPTAPQ